LKALTILRPIVFAAALIPAAALAYGLYQLLSGGDVNALTANPGDYITDQTGTWALAFLFISLTITPIRRLTGWTPIIKLRRMLGLFSFFYATLHLSTWLVFIHYFDLKFMIEDVIKRRFITIGMLTYVMLLALAVTSNRFAVRKLGRKWQTLHRLAYAAAVTAVIHFWWLVKQDITEPRRWAFGLAGLLGLRVWWAYRGR
jgi:sulfoxide reductase heme-binding subunit YedZ